MMMTMNNYMGNILDPKGDVGLCVYIQAQDRRHDRQPEKEREIMFLSSF